jgi:hypothetical protein
VYATGDVSFNIIWPIQLVEGSKPELNPQSDDANVVVAIKDEYETAVLMGGRIYGRPKENRCRHVLAKWTNATPRCTIDKYTF